MKYLVLLDNKKRATDAIVQFKFRDLRYEQIQPDRFILYGDKKVVAEMNTIFDWMACIKTE